MVLTHFDNFTSKCRFRWQATSLRWPSTHTQKYRWPESSINACGGFISGWHFKSQYPAQIHCMIRHHPLSYPKEGRLKTYLRILELPKDTDMLCWGRQRPGPMGIALSGRVLAHSRRNSSNLDSWTCPMAWDSFLWKLALLKHIRPHFITEMLIKNVFEEIFINYRWLFLPSSWLFPESRSNPLQRWRPGHWDSSAKPFSPPSSYNTNRSSQDGHFRHDRRNAVLSEAAQTF